MSDWQIIHTETRDGFDIVLSVAPEDLDPRGQFDDDGETASFLGTDTMTTQHTPGPWHVTGDEHGTMITDNTGEQIALWPQQGGTVEQCANARLIAAAPDLLAALQLIHANAAESSEWIRARIDAAITRATGGDA